MTGALKGPSLISWALRSKSLGLLSDLGEGEAALITEKIKFHASQSGWGSELDLNATDLIWFLFLKNRTSLVHLRLWKKTPASCCSQHSGPCRGCPRCTPEPGHRDAYSQPPSCPSGRSRGDPGLADHFARL